MIKNNITFNNLEYSKVCRSDFFLKKFLRTVSSIEKLSLYAKPIAVVYENIFYRKMIDNELKLAGAEIDSKIAHIGSGPFPMTAIRLAEKGHQVDCFDIDYTAIEKSKDLVDKKNISNRIKILHIENASPDYQKYDIFIVSLHIIGKKKVLNEIIEKSKDDAVIVYRNTRGLLKKFYQNFYPDPEQFTKINIAKQFFFKESIALLKKTKR